MNKVEINTVGEHEPYTDNLPKFSLMDIVYGKNTELREIQLGVILMGPINVPFFETGAGTDFSKTPLKITNPEEWSQTYRCYIVFDLHNRVEVICPEHNLKKIDHEKDENKYILFDQATSQMRIINGLLEL